MFVLFVELYAVSGRASELKDALRFLVENAQSEPGIRFYSVNQSQANPDHFLLYEHYQDRAAWHAHLVFPPVREKLSQFEHLLKCPPKLTYCDSVASTLMAPADD